MLVLHDSVMKPKTNLGRPSKGKENSQTKCVSVWLLPEEKEAVAMASKSARLPTSTWAGKVLVEAAKRALLAVGM
jgi:hypothetical protein